MRKEVAPRTAILNVAIIPPPTVEAEVAKLSSHLCQSGGLFEVDGSARLAHMTLYMARFPEAQVGPVIAKLANVARCGIRFFARHTGFFVTPGKYYEISYAKNESLVSLHDAVTKELLPLRFSPGAPVIEEYFGAYSAAQRDQAQASGYDLAGDLYRPHITITRFADSPDSGLPCPPVDLSFSVDKFGLFYADRFGSVVQTLARFDLHSGSLPSHGHRRA
jgi:hypothetical protein